jgi:hypothetical protein
MECFVGAVSREAEVSMQFEFSTLYQLHKKD